MSNQKAQGIVALFLLMILAGFVFLGPIFTIWSLNELFGLEIPVTFATWAATMWLLTAIHGIKINLKKEN